MRRHQPLRQAARLQHFATVFLPVSSERSAFIIDSLKVRPMAITRRLLHLRAQASSARGTFQTATWEFLSPRNLWWAQNRPALARDVVLDFVQRIADGQPRGDLRNGEACRF